MDGELLTFDKIEETLPGTAAQSTKTYTDHIGILVDCKIVAVNDVNQTFDAFLNIHCHYRLPDNVANTDEARAIVGPSLRNPNVFTIVKEFPFYVPTLTLNNCIDSKFDDFLKTIRVNSRTGHIWVQYENFCTIFEDLELRKFPYDRQVFRIYLNTLGVGVVPWHVPVYNADYPISKCPRPNIGTDFAIFQAKNWGFKGKKIDLTGVATLEYFAGKNQDLKKVEKQLQKDHDVRITFIADRDQWYYQSNYILISAFLVFGTSSVFLIPVNNVEERQTLSITILLAMVALKFALTANTPVIGYNTFLDMFLLAWYGILFLAIFWNFVAASIVLFSCDNVIADEVCIEDEQQKVRDIEAVVSIVFVGLWSVVISVMIGMGFCKDGYQTTMANQTENVLQRRKTSIVSMETDKEEKSESEEREEVQQITDEL